MAMRVLAVNSGSSSVKFRLFDTSAEQPANLLSGSITGIGGHARVAYREGELVRSTEDITLHSHDDAFRSLLHLIEKKRVEAVGHRVVHGGPWFTETVLIDLDILPRLEALVEFAPLHNPACLNGIHLFRAALGAHVPMVAVFDTAFHRTLPDYAGM